MRKLIGALALCVWTSCYGLATAGQLRHTSPGPAASAVHPRLLLDAGWKFRLGGESRKVAPNGTAVTQWKYRIDPDGLKDARLYATPDAHDDAEPWQSVTIGTDVFKGATGFAWFRAALPKFTEWNPTIHFESVDDNADVFLNGIFIGRHEGWDEPFDLPLSKAWKPNGPNLLAVLVENTNGPGGIAGKVILTKGAIQVEESYASPSLDDTSWRTVHLPHDYVIEGKFSQEADNSHGSLPKPIAWYRRNFEVPLSAKGSQIALQFDGIYRNSKVWVNGRFVGVHPSGYTGFRYDITDAVHYGQNNQISVKVDPSHNEGWWYEGGGIYRHVWLDIAPKVAIAPNGVYITTSLPEPQPGVPIDSAQVEVLTGVATRSSLPQEVQVDSKIVDERGKLVASAATLISYPSTNHAPTVLTIDKPKLWSLEHPHLYWLKTQLEVGDRVVDSRVTTFGVRTIRFDPQKGFFLNGVQTKIQGTCNHQDFAGLGIAVPDTLQYWRIKKLKEMGCNAWRMSHNPPNPALLDAADKLGMLVMDENRHLGDSNEVLGELSSMVLRDRNHPSVILWSMCNEQPEAGSERGRNIFSAMKNTVLKLDSTRPITSAMNSGWFGTGFTGVEDLMGVNYNYEVYDRFHQLHPEIPLFGSETASTVTTRGEYVDDPKAGAVSSYNMTDDTWIPAAERAFVAGDFVWTGFDYKGEPTPYTWPSINSNFGLMDICGLPKDNYYYFKAWWNSSPSIHILPHWTWPGSDGKPIRVVVFSNAASVSLSLNGKQLGVKQMPRYGHLEWTVPYEPGHLDAQALDDHHLVTASDTVTTAGRPVALRLGSRRKELNGDGEDVEVVTVELIDSHANICPTAGNRVSFTVTGSGYLAGVGNGNPADHDPDKASSRTAFNGKCVVIVGAKDVPGPIRLQATSLGLKSAELQLVARP